MKSNTPTTRRDFVKTTALVSAGMAISPVFANISIAETLRIGFVGTGLRGRNHINNILDLPNVICPAICDIDPEAIQKTKKLFESKGLKMPTVYAEHEESFRDMLTKEKLDAVLIATDWRWHTPICIAAMEAGVYTGVEVSGAFSVEECWELVETFERTKSHLFFLENVNYRRDVMAVLNMVRDGVFGELIHARGGYQHDLREVKFDDGKGGLVFGEGAVGEARWRTQHSVNRNGELYPTHGLGPVSAMLDINRGNRLVSLSSVSTKARGLAAFVQNHPQGGTNHPYASIDWSLGDVVTTTLTTAQGQTILLTHDTNLPRPYSLGFRIQGVKGLAEFDYHTRRVYAEGSSKPHRWDEWSSWFEKYDHPLWKKYGEEAESRGHGGMDFFLDRAFVECARSKSPALLDAYDAATFRVITPLSEQSIRQGGMPLEIPDFTKGKWMVRRPIFGLGQL